MTHFCTPYNFVKYWPIFKLVFTVRIRRTFVIIMPLKIPLHLKWVATLWNVSVLKATIENKTTSVTTHFKSVWHTQQSAVPLLTLVRGCRRKLLKQWDSFVGQWVVHCLTWMNNYLIQFDLTLADSSSCNILCCDITVVTTYKEYFSSMGWVGLRKLDPWPCLSVSSSSKADTLKSWYKNCRTWQLL